MATDLDLADIEFDHLELRAFGGVHIAFPDGRAKFAVNYD